MSWAFTRVAPKHAIEPEVANAARQAEAGLADTGGAPVSRSMIRASVEHIRELLKRVPHESIVTVTVSGHHDDNGHGSVYISLGTKPIPAAAPAPAPVTEDDGEGKGGSQEPGE